MFEKIQVESVTTLKILKKEMVYEEKSKQIFEKTLKFSGLGLGIQIDYRSVKIY